MTSKWRKQMMVGALSLTLAAGNISSVFAGTAPDGKTEGSDLAQTMRLETQWKQWKRNWNSVKNDWTQISLTPGSTASELNFAWYTPKQTDDDSSNQQVAAQVAKVAPGAAETKVPKLIIGEGRNMRNAKVYDAKQRSVEKENDAEGKTYNSNKVEVSGLKENTTYYYSYDNGSGYTDPEAYTTKSTNNFNFVFVGDPQIGSSNELKGQDTEEFYNAQSDAVRSDAFNWSATLNAAAEKTGNQVSFVVSAGDQIQTTKKKAPNKNAANSEIEYAGYLSPDILKSLPVATSVGNHDADNENYTYHFNTPNSSELGSNGVVGGDYYFTYGDVLFMMLNTQDTNVAEHKQFIEDAVAKNKDCKWRIVTLHQDIYGSAEHSNEPEITNLRYALTPYFEENDVDVVLTGHDHAYSRSKIMLGGKQSETAKSYTDDEFDEQLDKDLDYSGDQTLFVAPGNIKDDTTDSAEQKYLAYLKSIMDDNAVEAVKQAGETVMNPEGILYMTASSSSGSKYYDLVPRKQTYIANRWQEDVPTYSIVNVTGNRLTIDTYRTDTDEKIDDTFSILKNKGDKASLSSSIKSAEDVQKVKNTYTTASYKVFEQALQGAKKVAADKYAADTEIENALKALNDAKTALVKKLSIGNAYVAGLKTRVYTGKKQAPSLTVKVRGKVLKKDKDYTVVYGNNVNTGKAYAKITAKGDYTGTKIVYFNIAPKKVTVSVKSSSSKKAKVTIKTAAGKVSGYQIRFATNSKFKGAKTKSTTKTKYTLTSLKSKKTYYVKVRAYKKAAGKTVYGAYSKTIKVKVK